MFAKIGTMKRYNWVWVFLMLACSDHGIDVIPGSSYFPLHVNQYWDYTVNETDILQTTTCADGGQTIKSFQLRMLVTDSIKSSGGGYTFVIHRYTRPDNISPWSDLDTWTARITTNSVIQTEGNTPYVKFIFPFGDSTKWNGNLYNDFPAENYYASSVGKSFGFNSTSYPKTITVSQRNYDDFFISRDKRNEVYAYNIGLVYKKIDQRTYFLDPCYGQQKIQKGLFFEQSLIGYGKL
jgi:hypothetical protein